MCHLLHSFKAASKNSCCIMGSPPVNVTPPSEPQLLKSRRRICISSPTVISRTHCLNTLLGQIAVHSKVSQSLQISQVIDGFPSELQTIESEGQIFSQALQPLSYLQTFSANIMCFLLPQLSGFAHQRHFSGHPSKKTLVRQPGPSCTEKLWISKISPFGSIAAPYLAYFSQE
ncbi:Uncharacterised protein [Blautia hydrogenotrophica]|nr:Uncharacterised protein [Blautia hydrogenotrophica]SCH49440.1 Uncharacterised protein [uncultured Blautia sp.]